MDPYKDQKPCRFLAENSTPFQGEQFKGQLINNAVLRPSFGGRRRSEYLEVRMTIPRESTSPRHTIVMKYSSLKSADNAFLSSEADMAQPMNGSEGR